MSVESVARQHSLARRRIVDGTAQAARSVWARLNTDLISASWRALLPEVLIAVTGAQRLVAGGADSYLDRVLAEQGANTAAAGQVNPRRLSGVASDGRRLDTLLNRPAAATLGALATGRPLPMALATGQATLDMIVRTQIADAGRVADQIATVARPVAGYVRMLSPPACSRCVILAGRRYRWNQGFRRHPDCQCVHIPAAEAIADDLRLNPRNYFDGLSSAEQDRIFTHAGAEAIRDGADMSRVVNASRGMYAAGGRQLTREATTRLGINRPVRLMPEQIMREAKGNRDETLRLLRLNGFIL